MPHRIGFCKYGDHVVAHTALYGALQNIVIIEITNLAILIIFF
jgi:O-acetylhomoserine/O-acetylserine sulfhydrylase-like pyridoxal-dependent enzyme